MEDLKKEEQEAINWLSALDIKSEYEATNKEIILNYIDELELKLLARERGEAELETLIEQLEEENKQLKNDNQVLRETLYGGNVSE